MATRRCCSGCSGSNNCYGALNCVSGPYNCRNPYYTGPCAQASCTDGCGNTVNNCNSNCSCHHNCWCPWVYEDTTPVQPDPNPPTPSLPPFMPGMQPTSAYGFFTAVPPVTVAAGGAVPLQTNLANDRYFSNNNGNILIRRAGTYLVTYTVQLGAGETTGSQYYLALNGTAINASAVNASGDTTTSESYTSQVIVQAPANSTLTLNSSDAITLDGTAISPYNLTIVRLA